MSCSECDSGSTGNRAGQCRCQLRRKGRAAPQRVANGRHMTCHSVTNEQHLAGLRVPEAFRPRGTLQRPWPSGQPGQNVLRSFDGHPFGLRDAVVERRIDLPAPGVDPGRGE